MIKVIGKYYPKGPDLRSPKNYVVILDVDSIYEDVMSIEDSNILIMSAIHLKYKVAYKDLSPHYSVGEILLLMQEKEVTLITDKVDDQRFTNYFRHGLNYYNTPEWLNAAIPFANALEREFDVYLEKKGINIPREIKLFGKKIKYAKINNNLDEILTSSLYQASHSRAKASHPLEEEFTKLDLEQILKSIKILASLF